MEGEAPSEPSVILSLSLRRGRIYWRPAHCTGRKQIPIRARMGFDCARKLALLRMTDKGSGGASPSKSIGADGAAPSI
jgi:hypothetical protein